MQSRLATIAARSSRVFSVAHNRALQQKFLAAAAAASRGRTADPAIHSGELEAGPDVHYREPEGTDNATEAEPAKPASQVATEYKPSKDNETEPLVPPKPPHIPSPRLESTSQPVNPHIQQKRRSSTSIMLEDVICAGIDGTPLPEDKENEQRDKFEKIQDEKAYFSHRKASPLSEIEVADTRKPITRATDGTAYAGDAYGATQDVIGWRPEQLDTAEEALRRATEIFRQNAMRGDPDVFPHSRVLRELRGEWF